VAWTFNTGDMSDGRGGQPRSGFQTTPIFVDGTLFLTTPTNQVIALDPERGTERGGTTRSPSTLRPASCAAISVLAVRSA
jgi:glucose dehydrogenase